MSAKTVLDKIGEDAKDVFNWLGSSTGKADVGVAESVVEGFVPGAAGAIVVFNSWLTEIFKVQALAAAAGAESGSSGTKAAVVLSTITPQILAFAKANNLATPTTAQLNSINTLLVAALNTLGVASASTSEASPQAAN